MNKKSRNILYAAVGLFSVVIGGLYNQAHQETHLLQGSLLTALKAVTHHVTAPEEADLVIENVSLKKIQNPTDDFNFYKYRATLIVTNQGEDLKKAQAVLTGGDNQGSSYVHNSEGGFTLEGGEKYIITDYEVVFDGRYNGGTLDFMLELKDKFDADESDNQYSYTVYFEAPSKIENIKANNIDSGENFMLSMDIPDYASDYNLEIFTTDNYDYSNKIPTYGEFYHSNKLYSYDVIKNSEKVAKSADWDGRNVTVEELRAVSFAEDPFNDDSDHYLYVKATDPETGNYLVSDILHFPVQQELNRAEFAQVFVEGAGMDLASDGVLYLDDVHGDDWFAPYALSLYNAGLLDPDSYEFNPADEISRGEVVQFVIDYFDVDLVEDEDNDFDDIYLDSLFANLKRMGEDGGFVEDFYPDLPATTAFVNHLIDAYK